jgi:hypothetical protein
MGTLPSWRDGKARAAIDRFVERVTDERSPDHVPPAERIAVFDNDGTLWCEKPMPVELVFILERFREMVAADPSLAERQPWKAAHEGDYAWLGGAVAKHYAGDDSVVKVLMGGILEGFAGMSVEAIRRRLARVPHDRRPSDSRQVLQQVQLSPDGRVAPPPDGQRLHELHRLRRRSGLHAVGHRRGLRHSLRARDRQLECARLRAR